ncbi:hypothetical protein ACFE04_007114 [Oxalis oulophora]
MENPILVGDNLESSSCCREKQEQKVDDLLDKGWFFGNSLNKNINHKKIISRCLSDPCPSKISNDTPSENPLARAPSLPVYVGSSNSSSHQEKQGKSGKPVRKKLERSSSSTQLIAVKLNRVEEKKVSKSDSKVGKNVLGNGLLRSHSLRLCLETEEEEEEEEEIPDEESYARLSNLIRLALPDTSAPRQTSSKSKMRSCSNPRPRPPRSSEAETTNPNSGKEIKPQNQNSNQTRLRRTMTSLEFEDRERFKDKTFQFKNENKSFAGLQEKKIPVRRQSFSASPPIPKRVIKEPTPEDMKTHIKFWARAVACNVHQEC